MSPNIQEFFLPLSFMVCVFYLFALYVLHSCWYYMFLFLPFTLRLLIGYCCVEKGSILFVDHSSGELLELVGFDNLSGIILGFLGIQSFCLHVIFKQ